MEVLQIIAHNFLLNNFCLVLTEDVNKLIATIASQWAIPFFIHTGGMDDQISKNQCVLERMIVWHINPLELSLCWFDSSERDDIWKKLSFSHPEKGNCANLPSGKIHLETETHGKNHN